MEVIAQAENLCFRYGDEPVLEQVNFAINEGDFVGIIGSNGSGKSTLLKLLLGLIKPASGRIKLFGKDAHTFTDWTKIGYVPQNSGTSAGGFPATAEEVVKANLFSQIGLLHFPKKQHTAMTLDALEMVGMREHAKQLVSTMSGGQRQRVMLARVLVNKPKLLILDEPTTGVDAKSVEMLYDLLRGFNHDGMTVLMVTHDTERVSNITNRMLCIEDGSLVELARDELASELKHKHKHPLRQQNGDKLI
ncbi:MAG: ABC transporter ATP-binding protein [Bacillota bacterium]|nr:ABC transporter ATP-binding protein [Bacillota bacterium]